MADFTASISTAISERMPALSVPAVAPVVHAVLRVGAGLLFMQHGAQKLFGLLGGAGGSGQAVELFSLYGMAGALEFFGGAIVVLGLFTRPVALLLGLEMIIAYFIAHVPQGGFPIQNGGEPALLFALIFAFLAAAGAGTWSVDGLRRSRES